MGGACIELQAASTTYHRVCPPLPFGQRALGIAMLSTLPPLLSEQIPSLREVLRKVEFSGNPFRSTRFRTTCPRPPLLTLRSDERICVSNALLIRSYSPWLLRLQTSIATSKMSYETAREHAG
jgi:hypothetical protein